MEVLLVCQAGFKGPGKPVYAGEDPPLNFKFTWVSENACPIGSAGGGGDFSYGWIFVILLLVGLTTYFVVGIIIKRKKYEATGTDSIPNKEFWTSLPGLVKDGFIFMLNKTCFRNRPIGD